MKKCEVGLKGRSNICHDLRLYVSLSLNALPFKLRSIFDQIIDNIKFFIGLCYIQKADDAHASITVNMYPSRRCSTHKRKHICLRGLLVRDGAFPKFGTVLCGFGGGKNPRKLL